MKKSLKIALSIGVPTSVIGVGAAIAVPLTIHDFNVKNRTFDNNKYLEAASKSERYIRSDTDFGDDIHQYADNADINLFYTGWGTVTYTYMMRLALTSSITSQVYFGYAPDASGLSHQKRTNKTEMQNFFDINKKDSQIINFGNDISGESVVDKWYSIITSNPNKKVNIWWNADHVEHSNGSYNNKILELAGFKNVDIHLLEDGAAMGNEIKEWITDKNNLDNFKNIASLNNIDEKTQYLTSTLLENVHTWLSMPVADSLKQLDPILYKNYHLLNTDALGQKVFDTRVDITNSQGKVVSTRISSLWPKITGVNWQDAKDLLDKASEEIPGKKTLILLGSYGNNHEMEYIKHVYEKYHDQYNIFYKGHPGHPFYSDWINNNYLKPGMYVLDPMIASEEITKEHIADGLSWDNAICVGQTSAMGGFPEPTYNHDNVLLELLNLDGTITDSNSSNWNTTIDWVKSFYNKKP